MLASRNRVTIGKTFLHILKIQKQPKFWQTPTLHCEFIDPDILFFIHVEQTNYKLLLVE